MLTRWTDFVEEGRCAGRVRPHRPLYSVHPLHTRFPNISGGSISEATKPTQCAGPVMLQDEDHMYVGNPPAAMFALVRSTLGLE
jgi:hypothetical protein